MRLLSALLIAACCRAQSTPKIGEILDPGGSVRPVFGVAGSFLAGKEEVADVLSFGCGEKLCLAKTDSQIVSATGTADAPPGPALFAIDGDHAVIYFASTGSFARWHHDSIDPLDWSVDGDVLALRSDRIAVRRDDTVWIVAPDGTVLDTVPAKDGPAMLLPDGIAYVDGDELVLHGKRFVLSHILSFSAMSPHYVQVNADGIAYALRIDAGREALYLLPGVGE